MDVGKYDVQAIIKDLKQKAEIDPYNYDGSYKLMQDTIGEYAALSDYSVLDYHDLNLVYIMAIGTWKQGIESKKKNVQDSHLSEDSKKKLIDDLDHVWQNAVDNKYGNHESAVKTHVSVGMFGTGFFSFQNKTTDQAAKAFIKMCADISRMDWDEDMFDRAAGVLTGSFHGMGAAAASIVLHCLKPYSFPILNSMEGNPNIFEVLGINIVKPGSLETYIDNCRKIKAFRDQNFSFKNYRIREDPAIEMQDKTEEGAQMVKHIILWQFKDELTEDRKNELGKEIKEKLEALHGMIPGLIEIHVQADVLPSSNADLMLDCSFTDEAALDGYAVHPEHVKIKDGIIGPNVKSRVCIDYHV